MKPFRHHWRKLWLLAALLVFLVLASHQLGLPGLHYDEAKEAGVNAMELLTGAPVTAFRNASLHLFGRSLPLMVQDYIGALNVYLALPILGLTGIGVPNLRLLALLTAMAALLLLERAVSEWMALTFPTAASPSHPFRTPLSLAGLLSVTLLAASPSFVFWSRQGIFVTNLTQPLSFWCIWQGLRWLRSGRDRALVLASLAAGLALYAKLLAIWLIGPFFLCLAVWWLWRRRRSLHEISPDTLSLPALSPALSFIAGIAFLLPLLPFLLFNWQTGGTFSSIGSNLSQSYYGVNNANVLSNLPVRLGQLWQSLAGGQFWYLGGLRENPLAPWLAVLSLLLALTLAGSDRSRRAVLWPMALLALSIVASLFTVSDLFITHYALLQPMAVAIVGISLAVLWRRRRARTGQGSRLIWLPKRYARWLSTAILVVWFALDLSATLGYHAALSRSGGLADHSDASYHLAYYLRYNGLGAPIALDWGMDAPVRYLSEGTVTPIEIFGYQSIDQPDDGFALRLGQFLENPDNVYLLHAPAYTVFVGRREALTDQAHIRGRTAQLEASFAQRDGTTIYEIWRIR